MKGFRATKEAPMLMEAVIANEGHCPCVPVKMRNQDTVCPCTEFIEDKKCICGMYEHIRGNG